MRDPSHPGWPRKGEKTEHGDVAEEWAWSYLRHFQGEKRRRQQGIPEPSPTLADATERWLRHRERTVEPSTVESSETVVGHLIRAFGTRRRLDEIGADDLQAWFNARLDEGYRASTLRNYRNYMAAFFDWTGRSIRGQVDLPKRGSFDPRAWADDELVAIRKAADNLSPLHRRIVEVALGTGARRNELAALRWDDFRPRSYTVRIERQVAKAGTRVKPLKGKRARTALVLPDWWAFHEPRGVYVIGGDDPMIETTLYARVVEVLEAAELNEVGVAAHSFRHTYARLFLETGGSIEQLQRFLGHASITTTQIYTHFGDEAAVKLARQALYE